MQFNKARSSAALQTPAASQWTPGGKKSAEFQAMICSSLKQSEEVNGDLYACNCGVIFLRKTDQDE